MAKEVHLNSLQRVFMWEARAREGECDLSESRKSVQRWGDSNIAVISPSFCWHLLTERDIACAKTQLISDAHCQKEKESSMSLSLCLTGICVGYATQWDQQWRVCAAVR